MLHQAFYLGPFLIEPSRHLVQGVSGEVRLEPKIMAVLLVLAEHYGETVPHEVLFSQVWQNRYVSEKVLTRAVSTLRKAFGDSAREPQFIETVPKLGYRLLKEPRVFEAASANVEIAPLKEPGKRYLWARAFLLLSLVFFSFWLLRLGFLRGEGERPEQGGPALPLTFEPGLEIRPSVSPSGDQVLYAGQDDGGWRLFSRPLTHGAPRPISKGKGVELAPVWSPFGKHFAYLRFYEDRGEVIVRRGLQGSDRTVAVLGVPPRPGFEAMISRLTWTPSSDAVVWTRPTDGGLPLRITAFDVETGEQEALSFPEPGQVGDWDACFSENGRYMAFARMFNIGVMDLMIRDLVKGETRRVTHDGAFLMGLHWSGSRLLFSSNRRGSFQMWEYDLLSDTITWVALNGQDVKYPASAPGLGLVYERWLYDTNIYRCGSDFQESLVGSAYRDLRPAVSGDRLLFVSNRSGPAALWLWQAEQIRRLTFDDDGEPGTPAWHPSGEQFAFAFRRGGIRSMHLYHLGDDRREILDIEGDVATPFFDPSGKSLYLSRFFENRRVISRYDLDRGTLKDLVEEGIAPAMSSSGELFFAKPMEAGLFSQNAAGEVVKRFDFPAAGLWGAWCLQGNRIYALRSTPADSVFQLVEADLTSGELKDIRKISGRMPLGEKILSVDESGDVYLTLIDAFHADLWYQP